MTDPRTAELERKYNRTARVYDFLDWPWERQYRRWRPLIVGDLEGRVLEVGVGTGRNLRFYGPDAEVEAVDLSGAMLARARKRAASTDRSIELRQADALSLDHVEDGSLDWYVATFLYCVLPDELQSPALEETARVLRPGGRFRLVEILYSKKVHRRLIQRAFAPFVKRVYGAQFDRRTRSRIAGIPELEITSTRWLQGDTHLLIEGKREG